MGARALMLRSRRGRSLCSDFLDHNTDIPSSALNSRRATLRIWSRDNMAGRMPGGPHGWRLSQLPAMCPDRDAHRRSPIAMHRHDSNRDIPHAPAIMGNAGRCAPWTDGWIAKIGNCPAARLGPLAGRQGFARAIGSRVTGVLDGAPRCTPWVRSIGCGPAVRRAALQLLAHVAAWPGYRSDLMRRDTP